MDDTSQELPPGTKLGDYIIERSLGQSGFGITYLAEDNTLGTQVVIKENFPFDLAYRDTTTLEVRSRRSQAEEGTFDWAKQNFIKEARTIASLNHPNIVKIIRAFTANGTAYFVTPYIEGVSLDQYREKIGTPTEEWLRGLLAAMLEALGYLHEKKILHRNIKPGNILLAETGQPQLIDFGTARQMLSEKSHTVIESPGYTPFEQMESRGNVGPWSDIYALGGTFYKLITGETPPKSADRIRRDSYLPLEHRPELQEHLSPSLLQSIDKALAVWPEDRWQSAGEWLQELSAAPIAVQPSPPAKNDTKDKENEPPKPTHNGAESLGCLCAIISIIIVFFLDVVIAIDGPGPKHFNRGIIIAVVIIGYGIGRGINDLIGRVDKERGELADELGCLVIFTGIIIGAIIGAIIGGLDGGLNGSLGGFCIGCFIGLIIIIIIRCGIFAAAQTKHPAKESDTSQDANKQGP